MVGFQLPLQSLLQESDLRTHPTVGQFGQFKRIVFSGNEGFQHESGAFPQHIAHHRAQLDIGGFQDLVNAVNVPASFLYQVGVGTHQITQFPNRFRGNEAGFEQAMAQEVGDPTRYL